MTLRFDNKTGSVVHSTAKCIARCPAMALNDTKCDLWVAVDDYIRHFHLSDRLGYNDSQLRYTLTVLDDYRRMRDNYSGIKLVNDAKLVSNVIDMILQIDCYSDNANKDVQTFMSRCVRMMLITL